MKALLALCLFVTLLIADKEKDERLKNGEDVYNHTCISCHGSDGKAQTRMKFAVKPRNLTRTILSTDQIYRIVKDGSHHWGSKSYMMSSFKPIYNEKGLRDVAYFVSEKFAKEVSKEIDTLLKQSDGDSEVSLEKGEKLFFKRCAKCHGKTGNGESDYVEKSKDEGDFIYPYNLQKVLLNKDQIFLYAKYGGKFWGTDKNDMPAWEKKYNDTNLKSVALYIDKVIRKNPLNK